MTYCAIADVRNNLNLDSFKPSDAIITGFINRADKEIDELLISVRRFVEEIEFFKDNPYVELSHDFEEIKEVLVNGDELKELRLDNLLTDGDVEDSDNTDPEYWTDEAGTGDTLSWATDKSFARDRSLKIVKGAAVDSYWYSDTESVTTKEVYVAKARVKVDSSTTANVYLKMVFKDADGTVEATHTSAAAAQEITQPSAAGTVAVVSDDADDITQVVTVDGLVSSFRTTERIELNGTTSASGSLSFSEIYGVRLSEATEGTVTVTRGTTVCTLTASALTKEDWVEVKIEGETTHDTSDVEVRFFCDASSGDCWGDHFRVFRRNWKPLSSSRQILFLHGVKDKDIIKVVYERSQMSHLVKELSRDLASTYLLLWMMGAETSGLNYQDVKTSRYIETPGRAYVEMLLARFERNLNSVKSFDAGGVGFVMGESVV